MALSYVQFAGALLLVLLLSACSATNSITEVAPEVKPIASARSAAPTPPEVRSGFTTKEKLASLREYVEKLAKIEMVPSGFEVFLPGNVDSLLEDEVFIDGAYNLVHNEELATKYNLPLATDSSGVRIVGKSRKAKKKEHQECVAVGFAATDFIGSGVLIMPNVVLTAAHVVVDSQGRVRKNAMIWVGTQTPQQGAEGDRYLCTRYDAVRHENYAWEKGSPADREPRKNDVALVFLDNPVSKAPPARLATTAEFDANRGYVILTGFGYNKHSMDEGGAGYGTKRVADKPPVPMGKDLETYELAQESGRFLEFVAGKIAAPSKSDTCGGDSGGPAYLQIARQLVVAGLTSRSAKGVGKPCGDGGVYERVDRYRSWIAKECKRKGIVFPPQ
ncbi:trypsin [Roseimicrobium gellanilyticum]|uniref:Trypsin n=1 Tax=Roseimicrobium gellanilyticum TaxID=748857 RepID=A0A366HS77_9BACT|nr:trypsin-like serine protease [Roseimicrobium gellanilyticum]RBP46535.1 trypsin [Roseimicrobium gellanilyticum]